MTLETVIAEGLRAMPIDSRDTIMTQAHFLGRFIKGHFLPDSCRLRMSLEVLVPEFGIHPDQRRVLMDRLMEAFARWWEMVGDCEQKWCNHIKLMKRISASIPAGDRDYWWGYVGTTAQSPQNICEDWLWCPICHTPKPSS